MSKPALSSMGALDPLLCDLWDGSSGRYSSHKLGPPREIGVLALSSSIGFEIFCRLGDINNDAMHFSEKNQRVGQLH